MCPEGQNDSQKDLEFQSFDLILEPREKRHIVFHLLLIPWKYVGHYLSLSNQYLGSKAFNFQHQSSY
jgi:hypothetical protein